MADTKSVSVIKEKGAGSMAETIKVLLSEEEVDAKIKQIGEQISMKAGRFI